MSFKDEWAELVAKHQKSSESNHTQLNQLAASGGDGEKRLQVNTEVLREKASKADDVAADFMKADNKTLADTSKIKNGLTGFKSAGAFEDFEDRWKAQMKHLREMLHEKVAGALRESATQFDVNDKFDKGHGGDGHGRHKKVVQ